MSDRQGTLFGPPFTVVKQEFREELNENHKAMCPCCATRRVVYRRQLHSMMAHDLLWMYRHLYRYPADTFVRHSKHKVDPKGKKEGLRASDFAYLERWGLIESAGTDHERYPSQGYWRLTKKGVEFVLGRITVPKVLWDYYQKIIKKEGPEVTIWQCLGEKFDYYEMLGPAQAVGADLVVLDAVEEAEE